MACFQLPLDAGTLMRCLIAPCCAGIQFQVLLPIGFVSTNRPGWPDTPPTTVRNRRKNAWNIFRQSRFT